MTEAAQRIVNESKHFIEWTATDATLAVQVELLAVQRQLAQWQMVWGKVWEQEEQRQAIATYADAWAQQFLVRSGLLTTTNDSK
jgi:hypothetical protein